MTIEVPIDFNLGINPCYTFYTRYNDCVATEVLPKIMCSEKIHDYLECKSHDRENQFRSWYAQEYKKIKIISLPKYDDKTDSFVDGIHPASADSFFKDTDKMKAFFDLHKDFKPEKHHK